MSLAPLLKTQAVRVGCDLARVVGAQLKSSRSQSRAVRQGVGAQRRVIVAQRDELRERLEKKVEALSQEFDAEGVLLFGRPHEVLAEQEVDLLVVGSRGYGPLRTVLLGGVSGPLIRSATSPVLVLPRSAAGLRE